MEKSKKSLGRKRRRVAVRRKATINYKGNFNFMGKIHNRVIEVTQPIYYLGNGSGLNAYYSFNISTPVFTYAVLPQAYGNVEWTDLKKQFQLFRVRGIKVSLKSCTNLNQASIIMSAPTLCADILLGESPATQTWAVTGNCVKLNPTVQGSASKFYRFPELIAGKSGYPQAGSTLWYSTSSASSTMQGHEVGVVIGNQNYGQATATGTVMIAEIVAEIYMDFAHPLKCNN